MPEDTLESRLHRLSVKLAGKRQEIESSKRLDSVLLETQSELEARHAKLSSEVGESVHDAETGEHHVGVLERDLIRFIEAIDVDLKH